MTTNTVAHIDYAPDAPQASKPGFLKRMFTRENVIKFSKKAALTSSASFAARTVTFATLTGTGIGAISAGPAIIAAAVVGGMATGAANIWLSQRAAKLHNSICAPEDRIPVPSLFSKHGLKTLAVSSALGGLGGAYGPDILHWAVDKVSAASSAVGLGEKIADLSSLGMKAASNIFGFFKNAGVEEAIAKATPISIENVQPVAANIAPAVIAPAPVADIIVDMPEAPTLAAELVATPESIIQKAVYTPELPELDVSEVVKAAAPVDADIDASKIAAVAPAAPLPPADVLKEYIHKPILESITKPLTEPGHSRWFGLQRPWAEATLYPESGAGILANVMSDTDVSNMIQQNIDVTKVSKKTAGIVKEALAGDSQSMKDLAVFMLNGNRRGIALNEDQAVALFKKAASLGNAQAKFDLANMEKHGLHGIAENKANALQTLKELAAQKFRPAMQALGVAPSGKGVARAAHKAAGHVVQGSGVTQSFQKATTIVADNMGCKGDFKTGKTICSGGIWNKLPEGRVRLPIIRMEEPSVFKSVLNVIPDALNKIQGAVNVPTPVSFR